MSTWISGFQENFRKEPFYYRFITAGILLPAKWSANTDNCSSTRGSGGYGFLKEMTPPNSTDENRAETFLMVRKQWK
jgi:hypothetical protein